MSFSSETKKEIAHGYPVKPCCELAEAAGFFRSSGSIKPGGGGEIGIALTTGIPAVARRYKQLFESLSGEPFTVSVKQTGGRIFSRRLELNMAASPAGAELLMNIGIISKKDGLLRIETGTPPAFAAAKCCRKSLLKGLFLGAGSVADPAKRYHLEVIAADQGQANDIRKLMNSFSDINAEVFERSGKYIVYLKAAEQIKDMLGIMDANIHLLAFEDERARHEMRGRVNRYNNCDNANLDRQAAAGMEQAMMIAEIEKNQGGLTALPPKLRAAAEKRKEHPEANLAEIAAMLVPPVTKSAAAARFRSMKKYAEMSENKEKRA